MKPNENEATETVNSQQPIGTQNESNANSEAISNENSKTVIADLPQTIEQDNANIKKDDAANATNTTSESNSANANSEAKEAEEEYVKMVKDFQEVIKDAKRNITPPSMDKDTISLELVYRSPIDSDYPAFVPVKWVDLIGFSWFNPVPSSQEMKGDLLYFKLKTLEGAEYVITSNVRGFYINNWVENSSFDPEVYSKGNPWYSHSLVGLLWQVSPRFSQKLEDHINRILKTDPFQMSPTNIPTKEWTSSTNGTKHIIEDFKLNHEEAASGTYGLDTKGSRDWNEEIQVCKDLPKDSIYQRIQRDRAFYKIYFDFWEAAKKGATAIVK